ncbi:MAG: hypothetical protein AAGB34_04820 [Planctomycetota bacterium]
MSAQPDKESTHSNAEVVPSGVEERLRALDPKDPMAYFELGEDIAYHATPGSSQMDGQAAALAEQLFVLSYVLDVEAGGNLELGPSVCLALLELTPEPQSERRVWLGAMADALGRDRRPRLAAPEENASTQRAQFAEMLARFRAGEMRTVDRYLKRTNAISLLEGAGLSNEEAIELNELLEDAIERIGTADPDRVQRRPAPGGEEYVLDRASRGNPGPQLSASEMMIVLRAELALLGGEATRWSVQLTGPGSRPVRELSDQSLVETYAVDAERPVWSGDDWRTGSWSQKP